MQILEIVSLGGVTCITQLDQCMMLGMQWASYMMLKLLQHVWCHAAGFIATELVSQLLSKGYEVRGTVREPNNQTKVAHLVQLGQVRGSGCICFRKRGLCAQHPSSCHLLQSDMWCRVHTVCRGIRILQHYDGRH